jgi:hypothetical protein
MSSVIEFPTTAGLIGHGDICIRGDRVHTTNVCAPKTGREAEFAKWRETQAEIDRESYFVLNVLQPRDEWLASMPEPDRSVIIGNLRAAFNSGWAAHASESR